MNALGESMGGTARADGVYTSGYREISTSAMFDRIGLN